MTSFDVAKMYTDRCLARMKWRELAHNIGQMPTRRAALLTECFKDAQVGGLDLLAALQDHSAMTALLDTLQITKIITTEVRAIFFAARQANSWPWAKTSTGESEAEKKVTCEKPHEQEETTTARFSPDDISTSSTVHSRQCFCASLVVSKDATPASQTSSRAAMTDSTKPRPREQQDEMDFVVSEESEDSFDHIRVRKVGSKRRVILDDDGSLDDSPLDDSLFDGSLFSASDGDFVTDDDVEGGSDAEEAEKDVLKKKQAFAQVLPLFERTQTQAEAQTQEDNTLSTDESDIDFDHSSDISGLLDLK